MGFGWGVKAYQLVLSSLFYASIEIQTVPLVCASHMFYHTHTNSMSN